MTSNKLYTDRRIGARSTKAEINYTDDESLHYGITDDGKEQISFDDPTKMAAQFYKSAEVFVSSNGIRPRSWGEYEVLLNGLFSDPREIALSTPEFMAIRAGLLTMNYAVKLKEHVVLEQYEQALVLALNMVDSAQLLTYHRYEREISSAQGAVLKNGQPFSEADRLLINKKCREKYSAKEGEFRQADVFRFIRKNFELEEQTIKKNFTRLANQLLGKDQGMKAKKDLVGDFLKQK